MSDWEREKSKGYDDPSSIDYRSTDAARFGAQQRTEERAAWVKNHTFISDLPKNEIVDTGGGSANGDASIFGAILAILIIGMAAWFFWSKIHSASIIEDADNSQNKEELRMLAQCPQVDYSRKFTAPTCDTAYVKSFVCYNYVAKNRELPVISNIITISSMVARDGHTYHIQCEAKLHSVHEKSSRVMDVSFSMINGQERHDVISIR